MPRTASIQVIERKIKELEKKAEALRNSEKPGMKELRKLLVKYKLGRTDVDQAFALRKGKRGSKLAGKPLKAKYRNPANKSETWAGRGLRPKWLTEAMKETKKPLEHFAI